jgi:hypothetical protein
VVTSLRIATLATCSESPGSGPCNTGSASPRQQTTAIPITSGICTISGPLGTLQITRNSGGGALIVLQAATAKAREIGIPQCIPIVDRGGHLADRRAPVALAFAAGQLLILVPLIATWLEASLGLTQGPALYCLFWALPTLLAYLQLER